MEIIYASAKRRAQDYEPKSRMEGTLDWLTDRPTAQ